MSLLALSNRGEDMRFKLFIYVLIVVAMLSTFCKEKVPPVVEVAPEEVVIKSDLFTFNPPDGWRVEQGDDVWDMYAESPGRKVNVIVACIPHIHMTLSEMVKKDIDFMMGDSYEMLEKTEGIKYEGVNSSAVRYVSHKPPLEGRYVESYYFFKDDEILNVVVSFDSETGVTPEDVTVFFDNFTPFP